ncbi:HAD-IIB family hydrolase, partial [Bacillus cereus]
ASYEDILNTNAELYNVLAFSFDDEKRKKGWDHFSKQHDMTLVSSADHNFELEHKDASKGNALTYVVKELGGSLQDTIAIGDSFNDVSMLQTAGKGIAMANAHAEIKALADD